MNELCALIARHCRQSPAATVLPRLLLSRADAVTGVSSALYHPLLCVVAQGRKQLFLGSEVFRYDPSTYLVASAEVPVVGQIIEAPCLALTLSLDPGTLAELLLDLPPAPGERAASKALAASPLETDLLDPLLRLLRLLDRPGDIPALAPLIEREIHYRLLLGPRGAMLRQLALPASRLSQISRALAAIRARYDEPLRTDELARLAGMSAPTFHRHFRAVTAMSPLQYQKRLRLQEARRLLLSEDTDAARVGFEVGYESASQFSREYRRLFGEPPGRDTAQTRRGLAGRTRRLAAVNDLLWKG